jgi:hypothetical protein
LAAGGDGLFSWRTVQSPHHWLHASRNFGALFGAKYDLIESMPTAEAEKLAFSYWPI